jgi:hypothetical protein
MTMYQAVMTTDARFVLQQVNKGTAYLWNPPMDSWVSSLASVFYMMAVIVASPVILLLALVSIAGFLMPRSERQLADTSVVISGFTQDFTSYAIVRTLGIEHAHPVSSKLSDVSPSPILVTTSASTPATPSRDSAIKRPNHISLPQPDTLDIPNPQIHFTTPSSGNFQLAGVGLFSPPQSRTPSPPLTRKSTASSSRHLVSPMNLDIIIDAPQQGTPREEAPEGSKPMNAHGRDDWTDDEGETPSPVVVRRRKTGIPDADT